MTINPILAMFAKSPINPIKEHMELVTQGCGLLIPLFESVSKSDWQAVKSYREQVAALKKQADGIKREVRGTLAKQILLPVSKSSLNALLSKQGHCLKCLNNIVTAIAVRELSIPQSIETDFNSFVDSCLKVSSLAHSVVTELDELLETGFRGREATIVHQMIYDMDDRLEEADENRIKVLEALYQVEKELDPIDAVFLYQLVERLGHLAELADQAGAKIEIMLAQ